MVEQLETLGVESVEDIELFDADDIPFEGIPDWEYQDFAEQFPLKLVLAELKLDVEYFVSRKLVHVIYTEGNRKVTQNAGSYHDGQAGKCNIRKPAECSM